MYVNERIENLLDAPTRELIWYLVLHNRLEDFEREKRLLDFFAKQRKLGITPNETSDQMWDGDEKPTLFNAKF